MTNDNLRYQSTLVEGDMSEVVDDKRIGLTHTTDIKLYAR